MPVSVVYDVNKPSINAVTYTLFYLKTWFCPQDTFFDPTIDLCTQCPIFNCKNCYNLTVCVLCDQANNYFLDMTTNQCFSCTLDKSKLCTTSFSVVEDSFKIQKNKCNGFTLKFRTASTDYLSKISQAYFLNDGVNIISRTVKDDTLEITAKYFRDISTENLKLYISSGSYLLAVTEKQGIPLLKYDDN